MYFRLALLQIYPFYTISQTTKTLTNVLHLNQKPVLSLLRRELPYPQTFLETLRALYNKLVNSHP